MIPTDIPDFNYIFTLPRDQAVKELQAQWVWDTRVARATGYDDGWHAGSASMESQVIEDHYRSMQ